MRTEDELAAAPRSLYVAFHDDLAGQWRTASKNGLVRDFVEMDGENGLLAHIERNMTDEERNSLPAAGNTETPYGVPD